MLLMLLLTLSACGKKGPVRPVDTTATDTVSLKTDTDPEKGSN